MKPSINTSYETEVHIGTYENDKGYIEIYDAWNGNAKTHRILFAGHPTNNMILPLYDNGKLVCEVYEKDSRFEFETALSDLIETIDELEEL